MKIEFTKQKPIKEGQYLFCHEMTGEVKLVTLEQRTPFEHSINRKKLNPKNESVLGVRELFRSVKNVDGFWSEKLDFKVPNGLF